MKKLHGDSRLYNILFTIWLFYLIPTGIWLIIFPANFIIDSLVLYIAMKHYAANGFADVWRKSILRIWGIGFVCDFAGALLILAIEFLRSYMLPAINTSYFPGATIIAIPGVLLSGILIYELDMHYAFKKCDIEMSLAQKLSLALSIFTAPYAMLIPLYGWFYVTQTGGLYLGVVIVNRTPFFLLAIALLVIILNIGYSIITHI